MLRFLVLALALCGCTEPASLLVHRPGDHAADAAVTTMWTHEIAATAQDGDWILTRSYYAVADAIALAQGGEALSHASLYDAERGMVIEAVGDGVREIPLAQLVDRNHHVIVVRPGFLTAAERHASVVRARSRLGAAFDITGMIGLDDPAKVYCSELVWWSAQGEQHTGVHFTIVTPNDLLRHGAVVYWSGERTDAQVIALATARS